MEGGEECGSNESGWTKYIDPSDQSGIDDDDNDDDKAHNHHYGYRENKNDDDDDDSIKSDASSGPVGYHYSHDIEETHHHHHHHHGSKSILSAGKKPSKNQVTKEANERNIVGKGKETLSKTNKPGTGLVLKLRKVKKPN